MPFKEPDTDKPTVEILILKNMNQEKHQTFHFALNNVFLKWRLSKEPDYLPYLFVSKVVLINIKDLGIAHSGL